MRIPLLTLLVAVACGAIAPPAVAEPIDDRWRLEDLYATPAAWDADAAALEAQLGSFAACKGHLGDSAASLRRCMDLQAEIEKRYNRLAVYAREQLAADTGDAASLALVQRLGLLGNKVERASSFVKPEVLRIGADKVAQFVAAEPGLRPHRVPLDRMLRAGPHTLDDEGEALFASFGRMKNAGRDAYGVLSGADMPWPTVRLASGEEVLLDQSAYTKYRESPNRDDRKRVMDAFFGTWKTYQRTMGVLLTSQLKQESVDAKARHYADSLSAALEPSRVPVAVYDTLIEQTHAGLPTLQRYFKLRARMLGLTQMRYYDIYPPLVSGDYKFPLAVGKKLTLEAVAPLGADYVKTLSEAFGQRWMDAYPRPRKQSGAHMSGGAYDVHPYVLMSYNDDYESVTTLAHEWGHAMHSVLSSKAQPFPTSRYEIFVAEIASTFNESLLLDRMLKAAKSDDERLYYLGTSLENLRGTFFRQAMFAEFERDMHARVDRGEPLTGDALTKNYCEILKRYHGADQGVVAIDDAYCVEWAYIPHFYRGYYVYQYATSIAASSLFAQQVGSGDPAALQRYLTLLRAGNSDDPYQLVKAAGVDLATPAPYQALTARMNRIMDEMEAILARRGG